MDDGVPARVQAPEPPDEASSPAGDAAREPDRPVRRPHVRRAARWTPGTFSSAPRGCTTCRPAPGSSERATRPARRTSCDAAVSRSPSADDSCASSVRGTCSASSPCSPVNGARPVSARAATPPCSRCRGRPSRTCWRPICPRPGSCSRRSWSDCGPRARRRLGSARPSRPSSPWWERTGAAMRHGSRTCCASASRSTAPCSPPGLSSRKVSTGPRRTTIGCCSSPTGTDDSERDSWRDFCLRQADAVVLVSRADAEVHESSAAPAPVRQPDVVLVGRDPGPARRADWVDATDAWQLTVVDGDLDRRSAGAGRSTGRPLPRARAGRWRCPGLRPRRACCASWPTPACTSTGWRAAASVP